MVLLSIDAHLIKPVPDIHLRYKMLYCKFSTMISLPYSDWTYFAAIAWQKKGFYVIIVYFGVNGLSQCGYFQLIYCCIDRIGNFVATVVLLEINIQAGSIDIRTTGFSLGMNFLYRYGDLILQYYEKFKNICKTIYIRWAHCRSDF